MPSQEGAAENARSREKTGLKALEGDEDLVDYCEANARLQTLPRTTAIAHWLTHLFACCVCISDYLVMHPNTQHGLDMRKSDAKRFRVECCPKLKERFPESFQWPHWIDPETGLPKQYEKK